MRRRAVWAVLYRNAPDGGRVAIGPAVRFSPRVQIEIPEGGAAGWMALDVAGFYLAHEEVNDLVAGATLLICSEILEIPGGDPMRHRRP